MTVHFHPDHLADLKKSGLNDATIEVMGVYSARPADISKLIGWDPPRVESALVFPYFTADGIVNGFSRVKVFPPFVDQDGHKVKYLQKRGSAPHLYILPLVKKALLDVSQPLFIPEGEKKSAKANQEGLVSIAIGGLWSWVEKGTAKGIEELDRIAWKDRQVTIVPDSDVWNDPNKGKRIHLQRAVYALAKDIETRGAKVASVVLPQENDEKVGLDDFLQRHSLDELKSLQQLTLKDEPLKSHAGWWRRWINKKDNGEGVGTIGFKLTDLGNAERLVAQHQRDIRHCPQLGWLVWDARRWCVDESGEIERRAKRTVRTMYQEAADCEDKGVREAIAKWAQRSEAAGRIAAMIELAKTEPGMFIAQKDLDRDAWLLNVANGTLNLRTAELREHRREDFNTKLIEVEYDANATCPLWKSFINKITGNERDPWDELPLKPNGLGCFIQKHIGYSLTADTSEQCFFILYGTGQNGKSTFLNTVRPLFGDYAMHTPTETLLVKRGDQISNDLARLSGARMVTAIESEGGRKLAESLVKQLTGGDPVTARFLHREFFEFEPTFKLWLAVNHKPRIKGTDHAIWRRIRLIPFAIAIPEKERDKNFGEKLRAEFPGILAWVVEGLQFWLKEGLGSPESVKAATEAYRQESDTLGQFIDECCLVQPEQKIAKGELYSRYKEWAENAGERPLTKNEFGSRILERGFENKQEGSNRTRIWVGIGLAG